MIWDVKATNMVVNGRFYHRRYHVVKNWRQLVSIGVNLCQFVSIDINWLFTVICGPRMLLVGVAWIWKEL